MHDVILQNDVMTLWHSQNIFFQWIFSLFFVFAPTASILNRFPQTRYHFKAENLLFPTMYKSWWFAMICMCKSYESMRISMNPYANHDLYMVGKRRFSALKWYLVCENQLRIEAVGAKTKNKENIHWKKIFFLSHNVMTSCCKMTRINENQFWESIPDLIQDLFENHLRIGKNQQELALRINGENHQGSSRISENHQESARINESQCLDLLWESVRINSRLIQESVRIGQNWELAR